MNPRDWFLVAEAWAAGGGEHHAPDISGIIFPLLNFLIYAGIIYYFAFPLIRSFLKARHDQVLATVTEAAARKRSAEALVADYKSRLTKVDQEIDSIQALLKAEANETKRAYLEKPKVSLQRLIAMLSFSATRRSRLPSTKCFSN
jgi:F-type H+-transporting ATPase subunit b